MSNAWWLNPCQPIDTLVLQQAQERQRQLTKPAGSLGPLEDVAVQLAGLQHRLKPAVDKVWISIFAGDHGIVAEGVSPYPQEVTWQMLLNFVNGGAAISVLARQLGAQLEVVDLGTASAVDNLPGVRHDLAGPGTGLDAAGVSHKAQVIQRALETHANLPADPLERLLCFGGFEVVALVGAYLAAAQAGIAVLVDGYICTVAALVATRLNPGCRDWLLFGHRGAEPGHRHVLAALDAQPLLDLGLRLGEASGAALAVPLLRLACDLHGQMATFAEAAVADRAE